MLTDSNMPIMITIFDLLIDAKVNPNGTNRMIFPKVLTINCLTVLNSLNIFINGIKFNPPSETPIPKEATGKKVNLKINTSEKINSKNFLKIGFKINLPKKCLVTITSGSSITFSFIDFVQYSENHHH